MQRGALLWSSTTNALSPNTSHRNMAMSKPADLLQHHKLQHLLPHLPPRLNPSKSTGFSDSLEMRGAMCPRFHPCRPGSALDFSSLHQRPQQRLSKQLPPRKHTPSTSTTSVAVLFLALGQNLHHLFVAVLLLFLEASAEVLSLSLQLLPSQLHTTTTSYQLHQHRLRASMLSSILSDGRPAHLETSTADSRDQISARLPHHHTSVLSSNLFKHVDHRSLRPRLLVSTAGSTAQISARLPRRHTSILSSNLSQHINHRQLRPGLLASTADPRTRRSPALRIA